jgi:hypothetical protein
MKSLHIAKVHNVTKTLSVEKLIELFALNISKNNYKIQGAAS